MKRIITLLLLVFSFTLSAQRIVFPGQGILFPHLNDPSYVGLSGEVTPMAILQITDFERKQHTQFVNAQVPVSENLAFGVDYFKDAVNFFNYSSFMGSAAYKMNLGRGDSYFRLGFSGGVESRRQDRFPIDEIPNMEEFVSKINESELDFTYRAGLHFNWNNLTIGGSYNRLPIQSVLARNNAEDLVGYWIEEGFTANIKYGINFGETFRLTPIFRYLSYANDPIYEGALLLNVGDWVSASFSYKDDYSINPAVRFELFETLQVGYSYEKAMGDVRFEDVHSLSISYKIEGTGNSGSSPEWKRNANRTNKKVAASKPKKERKTKSKKKRESKPEPEVVVAQVPEVVKPESEPITEPKPESKPEQKSEIKPEPEVVVAQVPEVVKPESEPITEPKTEPKPESKPEQKSEVKPEPEVVVAQVPEVVEPESEPITEPKTEPKPESKPEQKSESKPKPEVVVAQVPDVVKPESEPITETKTEPKTEPKPESKPEQKSEPKPEPEVVVAQVPEVVEPESEPITEPKTEPKPESKPEQKLEPKPEPEVVVEQVPEVVEPESEPKPEPEVVVEQVPEVVKPTDQTVNSFMLKAGYYVIVNSYDTMAKAAAEKERLAKLDYFTTIGTKTGDGTFYLYIDLDKNKENAEKRLRAFKLDRNFKNVSLLEVE